LHHKRRRPASSRAGCKLCKPWKNNGFSSRDSLDVYHRLEGWSDFVRRYSAQEQEEEFGLSADIGYEWEELHQLSEENLYWWFMQLEDKDSNDY